MTACLSRASRRILNNLKGSQNTAPTPNHKVWALVFEIRNYPSKSTIFQDYGDTRGTRRVGGSFAVTPAFTLLVSP